jgi:hypothetical protein
MKKGLIGVWFSVALAIFLFSLWMGLPLGSVVARYWYRHKQHTKIKSGGPERAHLESMLSGLNDLQSLHFIAINNLNDKKLEEKYLLNEIGALDDIRRRPDLQEIKPAFDFNIGRAYVYASLIEEEAHNNEQASQYMKEAQPLFQSLGWGDYTEETLKSMVTRELDKWKVPSQTRESGK